MPALELDVEVLGQPVPRFVGLGEEHVGVEVEETGLRVDLGGELHDDRTRLLERAGDVHVLAELVEGPLEDLGRRHRFELLGDRFFVEALAELLSLVFDRG